MKVLLIGSSFSAVPMLFDLKRRGAHVAVIGKHHADPCHLYADQSFFEDYSDPEILLRVCRENDFEYIVPTCNDYSYVAASYVADQLDFPGFDNQNTTKILHQKDDFRRFCRDNGIPAPVVYGEIFADTPSLPVDIRGPALLKPVDSFSGRGVQVVRQPHDLPDAIDRAFAMSRSKGAVIEQFVEGELHSHTAFIVDGEIIWHDFVDEFCEVYPYQVDRSTYPSKLTSAQRSAVHESIHNIVSKLNLSNGLLHTQFIASASEFWIIECMRRCPGDLYGYHFRLALSYEYESQYVASFVNSLPAVPVRAGTDVRIERRVVSTAEVSPFLGVSFTPAGQRMSYIPLKGSGDRLETAPFDKAGIIFLENSAPSEPGHTSGARIEVLNYDPPCEASA